MIIFVLVVLAVVLGFFLIVLAGRRPVGAGGTAAMGLPPADAWLAQLPPESFERLLTMLFAEMKLEVERHATRGGQIDLWAVNPAPVTGVRVYVLGVPAPALGVVGDDVVRTAIETARAEQAGKAIVVTSGAFSPASRATVQGQSAELIDGPALAKLVKRHLPQAAAERHL